MDASPVQAGVDPAAKGHHARRALGDVRRHLQRRALKLAGYLLVAYAVLKLIPALEQALHSLEHVSWEWLLAAVALEGLSETGFIVAWSAIVDPQNVLGREGRGRRMDEQVAWTHWAAACFSPAGPGEAWGSER